MLMSLKSITGAAFGGFSGVSDLNDELPMRQSYAFAFAGDTNERRQDAVRPLMDFLPWKTFHRIVDRHDGDRYVKSMTCAEQFRVMAFAQLTYRESLRDIKVCLSAQSAKLYHMGFRHWTTTPTI